MKRYYTVKEAAKLLSVSTNTIYAYLESDKIKARRIGKGRFKIPLSELSPFINSSVVATMEETVLPEVVETATSDSKVEHGLNTGLFMSLYMTSFLLVIGISRIWFDDTNAISNLPSLLLLLCGVLMLSRTVLHRFFSFLSTQILYVLICISLITNIATDYSRGYYNLIPLFAAFVVVFAVRIFRQFTTYELTYYTEFLVFCAVVILTVPSLYLFGSAPSGTLHFLNAVDRAGQGQFMLLWLGIFIPLLLFAGLPLARKMRATSVIFFLGSILAYLNGASLVNSSRYVEALSAVLFAIFGVIVATCLLVQAKYTVNSRKAFILGLSWIVFSTVGLIFISRAVFISSISAANASNGKLLLETISSIESYLSKTSSSLLSLMQRTDVGKEITGKKDPAVVQNALEAIFHGMTNVSRVVALDGEGHYIASYPVATNFDSGADFSERKYYKDTVLSKRGVVSDLFVAATGKPSIAITQPVFKDNAVDGMVAVSPALNWISNDLNNGVSEVKIYAYDKEGNYVLHNDISQIGTVVPETVKNRQKTDRSLKSFTEAPFFTFDFSSQTGWTFYTETPHALIGTNLRTVFGSIFAVSLLNLTLSVGFLFLYVGKQKQL